MGPGFWITEIPWCLASLYLGLGGASAEELSARALPATECPVKDPFLCLAVGWAMSRPIARASSLCLKRVNTHAGTLGPAAGGQTP